MTASGNRTSLLCLSDTHIGAGQDHRRDALSDTAEMFAQVTRLAVERQVTAVLHAGDVFHRAKPSPAELLCFKHWLDQLALAGIPLVVVEGNGVHAAAPGHASALDLFAGPLVHVSRRPELIDVAGISVCTLPAANVSRLAASADGGDRAGLYETAIDRLLASARNLYEQAPADRPRVLLAHQMVTGASLPTGFPVEQVGSMVLPLWALEEQDWDAVVLGDIHHAQVLGETLGINGEPLLSKMGMIFYCGSPMTMDFGEQNDRHGCWLLEIEDGRTGLEFCGLAGRRFVTVDVDLTEEVSEPSVEGSRLEAGGSLTPFQGDTGAITAALSHNFPLTDAVLRVRYTATEEQHRRIDHAALHRLLDDAGIHKLYGGLQWLPVRETRARVAGMDESLPPMAAVDLWLTENTVDEGQARGLRELLGGWLGET